MITLVETLNVKTGCKNLKLCTMTWGDPTPAHQYVHYAQIYYNPGQIYYNPGGYISYNSVQIYYNPVQYMTILILTRGYITFPNSECGE